jgi:hypothetical protein
LSTTIDFSSILREKIADQAQAVGILAEFVRPFNVAMLKNGVRFLIPFFSF